MKNTVLKMKREALVAQGYNVEGFEIEDVERAYEQLLANQALGESEEPVVTEENEDPEMSEEEKVQNLVNAFKEMFSELSLEQVKQLDVFRIDEVSKVLDILGITNVNRSNMDEVLIAIREHVCSPVETPEVIATVNGIECKTEDEVKKVLDEHGETWMKKNKPNNTVDSKIPEIPTEETTTTVTKEQLMKLTATQLADKLNELGIKASKNKGKAKLVDMLFEALQPAGAVVTKDTVEVPMESVKKAEDKPVKKADKAAKKPVHDAKDNGPKMPYISKSDIIAYVMWKQINAAKLVRKDYVNADVMCDYVFQKLFYNKETKERIDYKKANDAQKAHVAKAIEMLKEEGLIKYEESVDRFKANDSKYGGFATKKGYVISPRYIARYCLNKGEDAVFAIQGRTIVLDFKTGNFANITDKDKWLVKPMEDKHWDALQKAGRFIGMYNRKTSAYTDFAKVAEEAQKVAQQKKQTVPANNVPPVPVNTIQQPSVIGGNTAHQVQ